MLKKHMAACLVATAFAAAPVFAQTPPSGGTDRPAASGTGTTSSGSSAMQPGATGAAPVAPAPATSAPAAPAPMAQSGGGGQGQFMTQMQPNQMMASSLIGTTVVSTNNESIGDVNDVIMDRNGQTMAVVIGVGGFLGIGEKDVAVPFQALDFNAQPQTSAGNNTAGGGSTAPATTGSTASNSSTATTGNTGNSGTSSSANSTASSSNEGGVPERVVLKMTKAELQAAPAFQAASRNTGNTSGGTGAGGATAPR